MNILTQTLMILALAVIAASVGLIALSSLSSAECITPITWEV